MLEPWDRAEGSDAGRAMGCGQVVDNLVDWSKVR